MVAQQLGQLIDGLTGSRLPPERVLAAQFGVSRAEIRKCLAALATEGRLVRHVGRGTFLRDAAAAPIADIRSLARDTSPRDAMQARLLLEPELASVAAVHATPKQIDTMHVLTGQMRAAPTWAAYESADGQLHQLIAACSGNKLLTVVHSIIDEVRRAVVWSWLDSRPTGPPADYSSFAEHDAIVAAIERRDRAGAAAAMRQHLRTTQARLIGTID